jgi:hypothetical protein
VISSVVCVLSMTSSRAACCTPILTSNETSEHRPRGCRADLSG